MYKKVWCTCEVVILLIKPTFFFFWRSRRRPRRWILTSLLFLDLLVPTRVSQVASYACEQALLCEYQRYPVRFMLKITKGIWPGFDARREGNWIIETVPLHKCFFEDVNSRKLQETVHHVRGEDIGPMFCDIPSQFYYNDDAEFLKVIEAISISKLQPAVPNWG